MSALKILFHEELLNDGVLRIVFYLPQDLRDFGSGVFFLPAPYFSWFFIVTVDLIKCRGTGMRIGAWVSRRPLRTIATEMSLFLASETLACFHKLCSLICVDLSGPSATRGSVHCVRVSTSSAFPCGFPLLRCLRFLVGFRVWVS